AGAKETQIDALDLRFSAAVERVRDESGLATRAACMPCGATPALKLYGGLTFRSKLGFDVDGSAGWVSSTSWVEREPDPLNPTAITFKSNALDSYFVTTGR